LLGLMETGGSYLSTSRPMSVDSPLPSSDLVTFILSTIIAIALGVVITYVFARRAFRNQGEHELVIAVAEARGLAGTIVSTERTVLELRESVEALRRAQADGTVADPLGIGNVVEGLAHNQALYERLATQNREKRGLGKYIRRFVPPGGSMAVDCGTATAWAFYECLKDGPDLGQVWTNNVFVASFMRGPSGEDPADPFLVPEEPSQCVLLGGPYYPSYGMTLKDVEVASDYVIPELDAVHIDWVLLGTTSLELETGPRGRSASNRGFKRALMQKALLDSSCRLAICMELDKVGLLLGEPCDVDMWSQLLRAKNCMILVGRGQLDLEQASPDARRRLIEMLQTYTRAKEAGRISASLIIVDAEGRGTEAERYLATVAKPRRPDVEQRNTQV
jgi:DeoR/GlpR family transcriptional regulator of sugar metabolism